jgi:predicted nucleic acid-binding protein
MEGPRRPASTSGPAARMHTKACHLAECALVVIANRYRTDRILSFDERHFRAVTPLGGGAFTILPSDG